MNDNEERAAARPEAPTDEGLRAVEATPAQNPVTQGQSGSWLDRRITSRLSVAFLVVLSASAVYTVLFGYITITKYYTFNVGFGDLGLQNQIYWEALHGSYFSSNYTHVYPFPLQALSTFILLPVYAAFPSPTTLLAAQAVFIGFAAVPLYAITVRLSGRSSLGIVLALAYLCYFPMQGSNMFDYHPEAMFPMFVFLAMWCWLRDRHYLFMLFIVAASLVDIITLITGILVILWVAVQERQRAVASPSSSRPWKKWLTWVLRRYGLVLAGLAVFLVFLVKFEPQTYHGFSHGIDLTVSGASLNLSAKLTLLFFILAPVAFLPVFADPDSFLLVGAPYFAFVIFVNGGGASQILFYKQYLLLPTPIIFYATARVFGRLFPGLPSGTGPPQTSVDSGSRARRLFRQVQRRGVRQVLVLVVMTVALAVVYSPVGPANGLVQGSIFEGNYNLPTDLTYTQHGQYLWHIIDMVPPSASVLTQNSIPQVSGRTYYGVAEGHDYLANYTYDYVLSDANLQSTMTPWSGYADILPIVEGDLTNRTYGIVAYADGVLLLEHGYTGGPAYFVEPPSSAYPVSQYTLYSGARVGNEVVYNASLGPNPYFFTGPDISLPLPGTYEVTFFLEMAAAPPTNSSLLTVQVTNSSAVLARQSLSTSEFVPGQWLGFDLNFTTVVPTSGIRFAGVNVTGAATFGLSYVSLTYTMPL